jgi:hypothetical protein
MHGCLGSLSGGSEERRSSCGKRISRPSVSQRIDKSRVPSGPAHWEASFPTSRFCHVPSPGVPEGIVGIKQASLRPPLLTRFGRGAHWRYDVTMEKAPIIAIVLGAMVFDLGLLPGLLGTLMEGFRNFRDHPSPSRRLIHHIQTDMRRYGDIRLVLGVGVMMVLGLVALPSS